VSLGGLMNKLILVSTIFITSAFFCYTIGVWAEKFAGKLKPWHLWFFWVGFISDTIGTTIMSVMSKSFTLNLHGITGALAIALMAFHAVWASIVLKKSKELAIKNFHKFSLVVWIIWLFPFISGIKMGMSH